MRGLGQQLEWVQGQELVLVQEPAEVSVFPAFCTDFDLLPGLLDLYKKKDFGQYAQDGELWVCFSGSNHTTGGNSGSPVLDKNGYLMGLNFDRTWESTMSDYMFDASRCRNVVVDIRYVLWVMDKYSGAKHLVDEMKLMKD